MIKTLSPHYKTIPWLSPESGTVPDFYTLNLYFWTGDKTSVPVSPTYEFKRENPLGRLGDSNIDIAGYIDDVLGSELITPTTTSLNDSNAQAWVKTEVIYTIGGVAQPPQFVTTELAVKGYGYAMEGINPSTPVSGVFTHGNGLRLERSGVFCIPLEIDEVDITLVSIRDEGDANSVYLAAGATTQSGSLVKLLWIECSEFDGDYITIEYNGVKVYTLLLQDEPRYSPANIFYKNKEGELSSVTFFKKRLESMTITNEVYEGGGLQPSDGNHQFITYNTNSKSKFSMDSGFIEENNNEIFKQLFRSNKVWEYSNGVYTPLKLGSKSFEEKTRQNDRLINYNVEFEYAFNDINNA